MGTDGPYYLLRPIGGGKEWQADPEQVERLSQREALSAKVKACNAQTAQTFGF